MMIIFLLAIGVAVGAGLPVVLSRTDRSHLENAVRLAVVSGIITVITGIILVFTLPQ
jgi:uncharacterized membrane protein HdeD (DUF308 family)